MLLFVGRDSFADRSQDLSLERQRALYVQAEQELKRGQRTFFVRQRDSMRDYPLYPYLVYLDLANLITRIKTETVVDFLSTYDGTPIADKLRYKWLKHLAANNDWNLYAQHYRTGPYHTDKVLACFYAQSLLATRRLDELRDVVRKLWLVDFSQPPECDPIFSWGKQTLTIDQDLIWQRILLVVKSGRIGLADYLAKQLDADIRHWYVLLRQTRYRPFKTLAQIEHYPVHSPFLHQVLLYGLARAQAEDITEAHALWQRLRQRFKSYPEIYEAAQIELGIAACKQLKPEIGLQYSSSLIKSENDKNVHYWHIRCALRAQQWKTVLSAIAALDEQARTSTRWLYWKARALKQLGYDKEAVAIWQRSASEASYYGYLAADRIGSNYDLPTELPDISLQILNRTRDLASLRRIYEFFSLARIFDARRELLYRLPQASRDERIGIALLCRQWGWATCAIEALADPMFWHKQLELRFPMPYREFIYEQAKRTNLPAYWIYAVMRRESAFMKDIKSPAGALGLMQLMPPTAKRVAQRIKLNYSSVRSLLQPELNIRLGSSYLRQLYLLSGRSWVTALASYNAGPQRVKQWISEATVRDLDIWIETVPFTETRRYLRAVLFYAVVYYYKLHRKPIRLKTWLVHNDGNK